MPEVDQITRPNDQSEQSRTDKIQQRKSPVDRIPELPKDRRETTLACCAAWLSR